MCIRQSEAKARLKSWRYRRYQSKTWFVSSLLIFKRVSILTIIEFLEQKLERLDNNGDSRDLLVVDPQNVRGCVYHASLLLANHLKPPTENGSASSSVSHGAQIFDRNLHCSRSLRAGEQETRESSDDGPCRKRKRLRSPGGSMQAYDPPQAEDVLPSQKVVDAVITKYFATIHHWIPMLHEGRFRERLQREWNSPGLLVVLHALVAITLRHLGDTGLEPEGVQAQVRISTDVVIRNALDSLSVENAQSLIMLCWDRIGSGEWSRAWCAY